MMNDIKKILTWNNIAFKFTVLLFAMLFFTCIDFLWFATDATEQFSFLVNLAVLFAVTEGMYVLNYYFFKVPNVNFLHFNITAAIIFLVIHPTTPWYMYAIVMLLAIIGKLLIRNKGVPVFNPAALGIGLGYVVSIILFKAGILQETLFESWWGADLQYSFYKLIPLLWFISFILLGCLIYIAKRYNKLNHALTYYGTYLALFFMYSQVKGIPVDWSTYLVNIFTGSYVFLALVMVTEPKTSPVMKNQQIWLGVVGGLILFIISNIVPDYVPLLNIEIPTILALLLLNFCTLMVKSRPPKPLPKPVVSSGVV